MMKKWVIALWLFSQYLTVAAAFPQDSARVQNDSIHNARLDNQMVRVQRYAAERLADSLKRAELEARVAKLSRTGNLEKSVLESQLNALRQHDSLKTVRQKKEIDSLRRFVKGFPVIILQDTLFHIYVRQGSFTAQDRAEAISKRIGNLAERHDFSPDSIQLSQAEFSTDIVYGSNLLVSVSGQDALWQNMSRDQLAESFRGKITSAVRQYRDETGWQTLLREAILAMLVIAVVT
ncbi:hypothetical protein [Mucilaginibacter sp. CSA2-8R]|uniref:hypothetical protein n=1 Tax=Mucilaginibacter sp. CSA2-8R TaxID=3141542 RepID=UPI00315DF3DD